MRHGRHDDTEAMNKRTSRLTNEHLLYLLALTLAAGVRLYRLGAAPLSDAEAGWALQALQIAGQQPGGLSSPLGAQPFYELLTGALFVLFGATNFIARFLPALAGILLVLAPLFFRRQLGRPAAILMAFGLALDPGLTAVSRQAGGPLPALAFSLLAIGLWYARRPVLAGLAGALALLAGPSLVYGSLSLGLAWLLLAIILGLPFKEERSPEIGPAPRDPNLRMALYTSSVAVILIGTLLLTTPQGLAGWLEGPVAYFTGWLGTAETPGLRLLVALPLYALLPLLFGLVTISRLIVSARSLRFIAADLRHPMAFALFLAFWCLAALLLALFYPARQVYDLVWVLVPLWGLAAMELARYLPQGKVSLVALGQAALVVIVLTLFWLTLAGLAHVPPTPESATLRVGILAGLLVLLLLTSFLVGLGWSWDAGRQGFVWGMVVALGVGSISSLWGATQLRSQLPQELWSPQPAPGQVDLLVDTLREISIANTGFTDLIEIQTDLDSPSLLWALKDFDNLSRVASFQNNSTAAEELPQVMITAKTDTEPAFAAAYLGQDFAWNIRSAWPGAIPSSLASWITFREAPTISGQILLWARSDLFAGSSN